MVSNFVEALALDFLQDDAAVTDYLLRLLQLHCPEADAVVLVALAVAFDPLFDAGAIVRYGVIAHGFGIGKDQGESVSVLWDELAQQEPGGLEDYLCSLSQVSESSSLFKLSLPNYYASDDFSL